MKDYNEIDWKEYTTPNAEIKIKYKIHFTMLNEAGCQAKTGP
jgi:hypothetical protein